MQPYICKKEIERTNPILDTLSTWYTQVTIFCAQRMRVIMRNDGNGRE